MIEMEVGKTEVGDYVRAKCGCLLKRIDFNEAKARRIGVPSHHVINVAYFTIMAHCEREPYSQGQPRSSKQCMMWAIEREEAYGHLGFGVLVDAEDRLAVELMERFG